MHRKSPCRCGCREIEQSKELIIRNYLFETQDRKIKKEVTEEQYQERCEDCDNLLYGYIKPIRVKEEVMKE